MYKQTTSTLLTLVSCLILLLIVGAQSQNDPEVTLSTGRVLGQKLVSAANRIYYSFRGIPYAAPPVNYLRFKEPQPPVKWNGTLKALDIPPACSQPWRELKYFERYSEDCLYINVFTPYLQPPRGELLPVMVWIHGGKHYEGSSTNFKYGADFLMTEDVIVVTFNYRLGVFGYLNMNTKSAQGNASDKDKIAALKWVRREIQNFGGNPNLVTIFGGSSGGQDVHSLYFSPMAKGLFHRAISQSCPSCGAVHTYTANPGVLLARLAGCPSDDTDTEAAVACLRSLSADYLAERQMRVIPSGPGITENPFGPTVEEFHGEEIYLPTYIADLMEQSDSTVPYMIGMNSGEGIMELSDDNTAIFKDVETNFKSYLPSYLLDNSDPEKLDVIEKKLKQYYFGNNSISLETVEAFVNLMTDLKYTLYIRHNAKTIGSHAPVYIYYFAFKGEFEMPNSAADPLNLTVVSHGQELGYLFFRNAVIPEQNHMADYPRECATLSRMVRLWTNFAKYGDPTPNTTDGLLSEVWLPVNSSLTQYLVINDSLHMETHDLLSERMGVWDSISNLLQEDPEDQTSVALIILAGVTALAIISFAYLIYTSGCRKANQYTAL